MAAVVGSDRGVNAPASPSKIPPGSPAPTLHRLLASFRASRAADDAASTVTQGSDRGSLRSAAYGAGLSPARGGLAKNTQHKLPISFDGSTQNITEHLFRSLEMQHQQQVLEQQRQHQLQLLTLRTQLEQHGIASGATPSTNHALTAANLVRLANGSAPPSAYAGVRGMADGSTLPHAPPSSTMHATPPRHAAGASSARGGAGTASTPGGGPASLYNTPVASLNDVTSNGGSPQRPDAALHNTTQHRTLWPSPLHAGLQSSHGGRPPLPPHSLPAARASRDTGGAFATAADTTTESAATQTPHRPDRALSPTATATLQNALRRASELELRVQTAEHEQTQAEQTLERVLHHQDAVQAVLQEMVEEHKRINATKDAVERENHQLQKELHDCAARIEMLTDAVEKQTEQAQTIARLEKEHAVCAREIREAREDLDSSRKQCAFVQKKYDALLEDKYELEAKIGDLQGERHQLQQQVKDLEKALDRLRWPPGVEYTGSGAGGTDTGRGDTPPERSARSGALNTPADDSVRVSEGPISSRLAASHRGQGGRGDRMVPQGATLHFPAAAHANTESDFNIFTGEPKAPGPISHSMHTAEALRRHRLEPATRMAWGPSSGSPRTMRRGQDATSSTRGRTESASHAMNQAVRGKSTTSSVAALLRGRLKDITDERNTLRNDLRVGYTDTIAQARAETRVSDLDQQIEEIENALSSVSPE
eukprot:m.1320948 g.1320948  ORF g.1320948 m.1320948 type:complete len:711 (-) comp24846_c0_seq23:83-2215(-)